MKSPIPSFLSRAVTAEPAARTYLPALALTGLGVLALSVVFNALGLIHFEWEVYIPFHLGPGSIWRKIFDSRTLDTGVYAGRELSYLVDHLDMLALAASVKAGCPVFISVVHVALSVFVGVWVAWFVARDLRFGSLIGLLAALLFWTTPYVYVHFLTRTAKILTTAGAVVLAVEIRRACQRSASDRTAWLGRRAGAAIALAAGVMSFADRQGFYFLLCALAFVAVEWGINRSRVSRDILLVLVGVLGLELVYFAQVAPVLTRAFWGYDPDFSFNQLPWPELFANPARFGGDALELLLETAAFTLGGIPLWLAAVALAVVAGLAVAKDWRERSWRTHVPVTLVLVGMVAGLWVMYGLMILRHPPLLWPDVRTNYYWIPASALVVLGVFSGLRGWGAGRAGRKLVIAGLLLALIAGNLAALPGHRRVFENGHLKDYIHKSEEIRYALMHRGDPSYIVPAEAGRSRAYGALLPGAPQRRYPVPPWDQYVFGEFYRRIWSPGGLVSFIWDFGGNIDARFLSTTARFQKTGAGDNFLGASAGQAEMRIALPSNRLNGELVLQRTEASADAALAVDFAIYAQPKAHADPRFERWREHVVLPAGQTRMTVPYKIDSSGLPTLFTMDIPAASAGRLLAGWRMPYITDIGRDLATPTWLIRSNASAEMLDEAALGKLLPPGWRPAQAWMRSGRVTAAGIELSPAGEIWLKGDHFIDRFGGMATPVSGEKTQTAEAQGLWYKAGRLQLYGPPAPPDRAAGISFFQAQGAEPGGWLVIVALPGPDRTPTVIRVTEAVGN